MWFDSQALPGLAPDIAVFGDRPEEDGLEARVRKRFKATTMSDHDQPVAANLLGRQFTATTANQRRVGDTTEFVIGGSGKLYLAAILDLFSRFTVGWWPFLLKRADRVLEKGLQGCEQGNAATPDLSVWRMRGGLLRSNRSERA